MLTDFLLPRLNRTARKGLIETRPMDARIPRVVHQIYDQPTRPPEVVANIEKIKALNPGWEYRLYDGDAMTAFVRRHYGEGVLVYFQRIDPRYGAARADFFRYLLMYQCGGVYLDIKSTANKPLDTVIRDDDKYLLSRWRNGPGQPFENWGLHWELRHLPGGEFQIYHIACVAGHPFLKAVIEAVLANIERYNHGWHGVGKMGVLRVTGPIAYTLAIQPLLDQHPHRLGDSHDEFGFEPNIYGMNRHGHLFKTNYAKLTDPVVAVRPAVRAWGAAILAVKNVKRRLDRMRGAPTALPGAGQV